MDIKVLVALHKSYPVSEDPMYAPIQLGALGKETLTLPEQPGKKLLRDDKGDNISRKNPSYCELTGFYYAWKNMSCDYLGLVHYRRYFKGKTPFGKRTVRDALHGVLKKEEAEEILKDADIIVPKKRRYVIETLESHYAHTMTDKHLPLARKVVSEKYPSDLPYVDEAYRLTSGYMFNMFIMKKDLADEYARWLFTILKELEFRIDTQNLSAFDMRFYGRISEILFNAWILKKEEEGLVIEEVPVIFLEKEKWGKKIRAFLAAKFFGKKYKESF
ncbi:MAG: DUF4422 domain-containing protein [Lachnospiraceae bacterium]|nr:DUF4422 domain-containing protein [Lachnospiraceae bacterium]